MGHFSAACEAISLVISNKKILAKHQLTRSNTPQAFVSNDCSLEKET